MSKEQIQQLLHHAQSLESYHEELTKRGNELQRALIESASAIESLKALGKEQNLETLTPIGMGAYVKSTISSNTKIILNIGSGAAVEKDRESTITYFELRIKEIQTALQEFAAKKQQTSSELNVIRQQMSQMYEQSPTPPSQPPQ
jgi:prefoldin alpha subunit